MVRAYVLISAKAGKALDVCHALRSTDGVRQADAITGEYDIIAEIHAPDIPGIGKLVVEKVQGADGVVKTITCLAVE